MSNESLSPLVQRVKELDEKALPGPWVCQIAADGCTTIRAADETVVFHVGTFSAAVPEQDDAKLIAEYRTLAPQLAAALAASQRETQEARSLAVTHATATRSDDGPMLTKCWECDSEEPPTFDGARLKHKPDCVFASWPRETDTGESK